MASGSLSLLCVREEHCCYYVWEREGTDRPGCDRENLLFIVLLCIDFAQNSDGAADGVWGSIRGLLWVPVDGCLMITVFLVREHSCLRELRRLWFPFRVYWSVALLPFSGTFLPFLIEPFRFMIHWALARVVEGLGQAHTIRVALNIMTGQPTAHNSVKLLGNFYAREEKRLPFLRWGCWPCRWEPVWERCQKNWAELWVGETAQEP